MLRGELADLRAAVELMRTHGPVSAPVDLYGEIVRAAEAEPMPGAWWRWLLRPFGVPIQGLAVAALALIVFALALDPGLLMGSDDVSANVPDEAAGAEKEAAMAQGFAKDALDAKSGKQWDEPAGGQGVADDEADNPPPAQEAPTKVASKSAPTKAPMKGDPAGDYGAAASGEGEAGDYSPGEGTAAGEGDAGSGEGVENSSPPPSQVAQSKELADQKGKVELHNRTVAYVLDTSDSEALFKLRKLVGRHQGQILNAAGQALTAYDLDQGTPQSVTVNIPHERLADFVGDLSSLGVPREVGSAAQGQFFTGNVARVQLTVAFTGAPQKAYPAKTRKSVDKK
jgi:hypothetical protein